MSPDIRNYHTPWPGSKSYCFFTRTPMLFIHIKQRVSTRFWTLKPIKHRIFSYQLPVDGALNNSGERFQKDAVSVSGFTGFIRAEGRFA